jgi:hypothetical protein
LSERLELTPGSWRALLAKHPAVPKSAFLAIVALLYSVRYLGNAYLPGNSPYALAWWGFWDQGQYLRSALALAHGSLRAADHFYPPGYALLAVPFVRFAPMHAFFVADLLSFVACAWCLMLLGLRLGIGQVGGALAFVVGAMLPRVLFNQYVLPWTTTPVAALYLAIFVVYIDGMRTTFSRARLAVLAGCIGATLLFRLADAVPMAWLAIDAAVRTLRNGDATRPIAARVWNRFGPAALVSSIVVALPVAFHLTVYGWHPSPYMLAATANGMDPAIAPFRYLMLFADPRPFFGEGVGILERYPAMIVGLLGLMYATLFVTRVRAIAISVWISIAVYCAYVDFMPTGIWRYFNIHYWVWIFPVAALCTFVAAKDLMAKRAWSRFALAAAITAPLALLTLRAEAVPATVTIDADDPHKVRTAVAGDPLVAGVVYRGISGDPGQIYFGAHTLTTDDAKLNHIRDFRMVRVGDVVYLVFSHPRHASTLELEFVSTVSATSATSATYLLPVFAFRNPLRVKRTEADVDPKTVADTALVPFQPPPR